MRSYLAVFLLMFKDKIVYRFNFLVDITNPFIQLMIVWFVWSAVYASTANAEIAGYTFSAIIAYSCIGIMIRSYTHTSVEFYVEHEVRTGAIGALLIKPINYPLYCLARELGAVVFLLASRVPLLIYAFFMLNLPLPTNALFFVSAVLGYFVNYQIAFLTAIWAFWTTGKIWGLRLARLIISEIASGAVVPLTFFPIFIRSVFELLPFQTVYYIPILIYLGKLKGLTALGAITIQLTWCILLFIIAYYVWKITVRKLIIQGG